MLQALEAAHCKLSRYYSQTENIQGDLYATSTMLAPSNKFKFFLTKDWDQKWRDQYQKSFKDFLALYQERLSQKSSSPLPNNTSLRGSRLDMMLNRFDYYQARPLDELREYLDSGMYLDILSTSGYTNSFCQILSLPRRFCSGRIISTGFRHLPHLREMYFQSLPLVLVLNVYLILPVISVTITEGG